MNIENKDYLILELPPSINTCYIFVPNLKRYVWSNAAKQYKADVKIVIWAWMKKHKIKMQTDYFYLDLWFALPRMNCDSHNYKKILFDALEHADLVANDKFIMDRTQGVIKDSQNPYVKLVINHN